MLTEAPDSFCRAIFVLSRQKKETFWAANKNHLDGVVTLCNNILVIDREFLFSTASVSEKNRLKNEICQPTQNSAFCDMYTNFAREADRCKIVRTYDQEREAFEQAQASPIRQRAGGQ